MEKVNLTERRIASEMPAEPGQRREVADSQVPGLRLRINHKPKLKVRWAPDSAEIFLPQGQYIFYGPSRRGGPAGRRSLGGITVLRLAEARERARQLRQQLEDGKDLAEVKAAEGKVEAERRRAEAALAESTFGVAMQEYFKRLRTQKQGKKAQSDIERDLLPFWRDRPLHEITKADVRKRILEIAEGKNRGRLEGRKTKKRGASPRQAGVALSHLKTFFGWAEDRFDLSAIPTNSRGLAKLIPPIKPRKRVLNDDEIIAYWGAADRAPHPLGQGYKLLLLTGARLNEIFEARKSEITARGNKGRLFTVPPERFKSDFVHLIPLSGLACEILDEVKQWQNCKYIFSRDGKLPARPWSKNRKALREDMLVILKEMAIKRGDDAEEVELKPYVLHDVRRTVRTRLSALRVEDTVAEMIIGHGRKGMQRVYDQHKFENEMLEALELWVAYLQRLLFPKPHTPAQLTHIIAPEQRLGH